MEVHWIALCRRFDLAFGEPGRSKYVEIGFDPLMQGFWTPACAYPGGGLHTSLLKRFYRPQGHSKRNSIAIGPIGKCDGHHTFHVSTAHDL